MTADPSRPSALDVELHEERLHVGTAPVAVRARVRKRIVTEVRQVQVTVRREVLEVDQLPAEEGLAAAAGTRSPLVLVLSEEVPVVGLEVRPYERVTLTVHEGTDEHEVSATVGTERLDVTSAETPGPG